MNELVEWLRERGPDNGELDLKLEVGNEAGLVAERNAS
jgi:hypothetical protein